MNIRILDEKTSANELLAFASNWYPNFLKGCVDLENRKVAVGGEYHIESAQILVNQGGKGQNIWGFNIRYQESGNVIEFDSMVNIKPKVNHGRIIGDEAIKNEVEKLILEFINI
jgi:hypothetical protein